jgi:Holliday junction resolvasome RuvABC DNA-binding subunit
MNFEMKRILFQYTSFIYLIKYSMKTSLEISDVKTKILCICNRAVKKSQQTLYDICISDVDEGCTQKNFEFYKFGS